LSQRITYEKPRRTARPVPATRMVGPPAIRVAGLRKSYGPLAALDGVDLQVAAGELFALLGPNGAGKTTMVEIMEGYRDRTTGEVEVLGTDPRGAGGTWRERVGMVLQESHMEPEFTAEEILALFAGYYPHPLEVEEVLELVGLEDQKDRRIGRLSGGQRRRLDVALALIGDPELLFLDEPTTGFDPAARRAFWRLIRSLRERGKTVFLTTHYMEEAEALADRVAIVVRGRIVAQGSPATLAREGGHTMISFSLPASAAVEELPLPLRRQSVHEGRQVVIGAVSPLASLSLLLNWARGRGYELPDLEVKRPSLEDVYLTLTAEEQ